MRKKIILFLWIILAFAGCKASFMGENFTPTDGSDVRGVVYVSGSANYCHSMSLTIDGSSRPAGVTYDGNDGVSTCALHYSWDTNLESDGWHILNFIADSSVKTIRVNVRNHS